MAYERAPGGVAVGVSPDEFIVTPGEAVSLMIVLNTIAPGRERLQL